MIDSADEFVRLRGSSDPRDYRRVAVDEASDQVWLEIITRYPEERVGVAKNKTVPISVLEILISDPDARVRFMVAMKRKFSSQLLERLAQDVDESIRMKVAQHKNTSRATLESLRFDPWQDVRAVVEGRLDN
ncbi:hypothetical protein ACFVWX_33345 [Streptomyces sp. NPDC058220]|uniref:hypothetical protein n=1 Tax=Streptomyces sp. NPDC058220 TaxID=3346387 RepID=UPI0036E9B5A6